MPAVGRWRIERRPTIEVAAVHRIGAVALGVVAALTFGVIVSGIDIGFVEDLWTSSFGTGRGLEDVATLAVPLILTGLAAAIPLGSASGTSAPRASSSSVHGLPPRSRSRSPTSAGRC